MATCRGGIRRLSSYFLAGNEGFEPPITGPEPVALPLGQFPAVPESKNSMNY